MPKEFAILSTQAWTYQDKTGQLVHGYRVFFSIPEFDETHHVLVKSLAPELVKKAIDAFIIGRKGLASL